MLSWLRSLAKPAVRRMQVGVDVSAYQGRPDTWRAEAGTISWAAVKLTELEPNGTRYVNEFAAADWSWLRQNNKSRIAYLFGHPSVSAADSVDFFLAELSRLGLENDDGVALDLEDTDGLRSRSAPGLRPSWPISSAGWGASRCFTRSCPSPRPGTAPG